MRKSEAGERVIRRDMAKRSHCVACGSGDTYPMRGTKGVHWWVCRHCGEEF